MKYFIALFLMAFGLIFGSVGGGMALRQHRMISTYIPVDAELIETHVALEQGSKGETTYSPEATYRYAYQGKFTAHGVLALSMSSSRGWAQEIVSRIKAAAIAPELPGLPSHITAYVDPADHTQAILLRDYDAAPYIFLIPGEITLLIGLGMLIGVVGGGRHRMRAVALDDSGWQLLMPRENLRRQFIDSTVWCAGALLAFGIPFFHWTVVAGQGGIAGLLMGLLLLAGLGTAVGFAYARWTVTRHMSDARLRVTPVPIKRGQQLAVQLESDAFISLKVSQIEGRLVCLEHYERGAAGKTQYGTDTFTEHVIRLASDQEVEKSQTVRGEGAFFLEANDGRPSSNARERRSYPWYEWEIRVHIPLEGAPGYRAAFPVEVV